MVHQTTTTKILHLMPALSPSTRRKSQQVVVATEGKAVSKNHLLLHMVVKKWNHNVKMPRRKGLLLTLSQLKIIKTQQRHHPETAEAVEEVDEEVAAAEARN